MERDCNAEIFLFGQSERTQKRRDSGLTEHCSEGVYQEFQIAKELGLTIIPVGATGYEAELIWTEVKSHINEYYYLSSVIDKLKNEKSPKLLSKIIVSVLND